MVKILYVLIALLAFTTVYFGTVGLGLLITQWLGFNIETGCSLIDPPMLPVNASNPQKCEIGAYKCVVSNSYHLYMICPVYGSPIIVLLIVIGLMFCIKQRCCSEDDINYNTPYYKIVSARY